MRYDVLGVVAAGVCACSAMSDLIGTRPPAGSADVVGHVFQQSGQPLVQGTVVIDCGIGTKAMTVTIDSTGRYGAGLDAPYAGTRRCAFGVPDLAAPRIRVDTVLGFAPNGQLHALQLIDLRER